MKSAMKKKKNCEVHMRTYNGNYFCRLCHVWARKFWYPDVTTRTMGIASHLKSDLSVVIGLIRKLYQCTNPEKATQRSISHDQGREVNK